MTLVADLPAAPDLPSAALARLAGRGGSGVASGRAAFLVGYPPATARAYLGDLRAWIGWCAEQGVHPFTARRHHVDHWGGDRNTFERGHQRL